MDCAKGYQVLVTKYWQTWHHGEKYCQAEGGHLVSPPQFRTCEPVIVPNIGHAQKNTSYTRLLDGVLILDNGVHFFMDGTGINCSAGNLGEPSLLKDKICDAQPKPVVCGRNGKILSFCLEIFQKFINQLRP